MSPSAMTGRIGRIVSRKPVLRPPTWVFRVTPALENAGYRPPTSMLRREHFELQYLRRLADEEAAEADRRFGQPHYGHHEEEPS